MYPVEEDKHTDPTLNNCGINFKGNFSANEDFYRCLLDSANECFSGCARYHKAANMNGRAIPGAYLFRLYVCDKEIFSLIV